MARDIDRTRAGKVGDRKNTGTKLSLSAVLVTQGEHRFYTFTLPSDLLARTCFVSTRDQDPALGFQRLLHKPRALEIADYIDKGLGTIPTSIVLSAQEAAGFEYLRKTKTVEFYDRKNAFLIIDGQHRVYGFSLAKSELRVPVVVYAGLSRRDETRLFVDINNKQRPVPNELLLEIKGLAQYESGEEERLRRFFDKFNDDPGGPLMGLLSPAERKRGKISRVTFNAGVRPLLGVLSTLDDDATAVVLNNYVSAVVACLADVKAAGAITKPVVFKAFMRLFPDVARRVQDRHGKSYLRDNFEEALRPLDRRIGGRVRQPGKSVQDFYDYLKRTIDGGFQL